MSYHITRPTYPYVPGGHYDRLKGAYRPQYNGYAYYVPQYANALNYGPPLATYPGWFYRPHVWGPRPYNARNRYNQSPDVPCFANQDGTAFCPVNSVHQKDDDGTNECKHLPTGVEVSAARSLRECQQPGRWPNVISYSAQQ
jgi:hypothetical protein